MAEQVINQQFRKSPEFIQTYSFTELLTGLGIEVFNCMNNTDSTGAIYSIIDSTVTPYSSCSEFMEGATLASANFEKVFDNDWDSSTFNSNKILRGKSFFQFSHFLYRGNVENALTKGTDYYIVLKLYSVDALNNETLIGTVQSPTYSNLSNALNYETPLNETLTMEIAKIKINNGNKLRLTVEGWVKQTDSAVYSDWWIGVGNDPSNTSSAHITSSGRTTTKLEFTLPFMIPN